MKNDSKSYIKLLSLVGSNKDKIDFIKENNKINSSDLEIIYENLCTLDDHTSDYTKFSDERVKREIIEHPKFNWLSAHKLCQKEENSIIQERLYVKKLEKYPIATCPSLWNWCFNVFIKKSDSEIFFKKLMVLATFWIISLSLSGFLLKSLGPISFLIGFGSTNLLWYITDGLSKKWWLKSMECLWIGCFISFLIPVVILILPVLLVLLGFWIWDGFDDSSSQTQFPYFWD